MGQDLSLKDYLRLWGVDSEGPYRSMLLDFIEEQAVQLTENLVRPQTQEAWSHQAPELRAKLLHSLGLSRLPERTPLSARVVGRI